jgi:recombination protein RecA
MPNDSSSEKAGYAQALKEIVKKFGKESLTLLSKPATQANITSSGFLALDIALGVKGYPKGRIVEIYGPESSGKTTLALRAIATAQKEGGTAAFIDAEHAFNMQQATNLGVDNKKLLLSQPSSGEEALEITNILLQNKAVDIIVIDSVSALTPQAEIDGNIGSSQIGSQARLMSQALRKLSRSTQQADAVLIFINQIRMKVGVIFGSPETTSGGNALKFYSSVRIDVRKAGLINDPEAGCIGHSIKAKIVKNKVASPFRIAEFDLIYRQPVQPAREILAVGVQLEVVEMSGSWFSYAGKKLGQGRQKAVQKLVDDPDLADKILTVIKQKST